MTRGFHRQLAAITLLVVASTHPVPGQQDDSGAMQSGVEETVRVILVQLPLLATDKKGNPITDLRADEVVVKIGRRKLEVEYLEAQRPEEPEAGALPPLRLYVDAPGGWQVPSRSTDAQPEYLVLFIDVENDDQLRRQEAIDNALTFVRNDLDPTARVAVLSFDGELHLDLPFTNDREALATAVLQAWGRDPIRAKMNLESRVRALVDGFEDCVLPGGDSFSRRVDIQCMRDVARHYADEERPRAEGFLDALEEMIQFLGGIRGRKTVLAVSHGVAADPVPVIAEALRSVVGESSQVANLQLYMGYGDSPAAKMVEVQRLAVRNRVTLHFLDRSAAPTSDFGAKSDRVMYPGVSPAKVAFATPQADLQELAATSGGIFLATTDVTDGLRKIERARLGTYELGYRLDAHLSDKQLASVKISTTRKGARLKHRRGFYARPTAPTLPATGRILIRALKQGPGEGAVGVPYQFAIQFDAEQIGYSEQETDATASFTLFVSIADEKARERGDEPPDDCEDPFWHHSTPYPRPISPSPTTVPRPGNVERTAPPAPAMPGRPWMNWTWKSWTSFSATPACRRPNWPARSTSRRLA